MPEKPELTTAMQKAFAALAQKPECDALMAYLGELLTHRAMYLASEPKTEEWQTIELTRLQGQFKLLKDIKSLLEPQE